jgi:hypothetical protein
MAYNWTDQGGYLAAAALSKKWQQQFANMAVVRQVAVAKADFTKKKGATFNWDIFSKVNTAGGALTETLRMNETDITLTQGSLTVTEFGNSIPWTFKMEQLSMLDVNDAVTRALGMDKVEVLDQAAEAQLDTTNYRYTPTAATTGYWGTSGTAYTAATGNLNAFHLKEMVDKLKELNCPTIGGYYLGIGAIKPCRGLYDSLEAIWQYTKYPLNGEIGSYYKCRVMEAETNALDNTIGTSDVTGEFYVIGGDAVYGKPLIEAVVVPEELRAKVGVDYGRDKGLAWYYLGGFALVHDTNPNTVAVKLDSL